MSPLQFRVVKELSSLVNIDTVTKDLPTTAAISYLHNPATEGSLLYLWRSPQMPPLDQPTPEDSDKGAHFPALQRAMSFLEHFLLLSQPAKLLLQRPLWIKTAIINTGNAIGLRAENFHQLPSKPGHKVKAGWAGLSSFSLLRSSDFALTGW